jgi:tRNA nucleotidyltransferase/poly(A) polymerase
MEKRIKHHIDLPEDILKIRDIFKDNGYKIYLVGGAVRDAISGIKPKDYDIATDAHPDEVNKMLKDVYKMLPIGEAFGIWLADTPSGEFEIATFREDIGSGRRPDSVAFTDIEGDVKRRDLTINALFYDTDTEEIVDLVGGVDDLKNGIVKSVGDPSERFNEDRLRILRAIRFAGITGSELDKQMNDALIKDSSLDGISSERIRDEFIKGLLKSLSTVYFLKLIEKYDLFKWLFPNLNINADYAETSDPIIVISSLLKDNNLHTVEKQLNKSAYSNQEIENIKFLISLLSLSEDNAYDIKKGQSRTTLTEDQIKEFAVRNNIDTKLITSFLNYNTSITGKDVMDIYNIKPGPDVGKYIKRLELDKFKDIISSNESYTFKHIRTFENAPWGFKKVNI